MGMAFVDELVTQRPDIEILLVDSRAKPGGHWNDAYPFVTTSRVVCSSRSRSKGAESTVGFELRRIDP